MCARVYAQRLQAAQVELLWVAWVRLQDDLHKPKRFLHTLCQAPSCMGHTFGYNHTHCIVTCMLSQRGTLKTGSKQSVNAAAYNRPIKEDYSRAHPRSWQCPSMHAPGTGCAAAGGWGSRRSGCRPGARTAPRSTRASARGPARAGRWPGSSCPRPPGSEGLLIIEMPAVLSCPVQEHVGAQ